MAKLAVTGQNIENLIDCSEFIPNPVPPVANPVTYVYVISTLMIVIHLKCGVLACLLQQLRYTFRFLVTPSLSPSSRPDRASFRTDEGIIIYSWSSNSNPGLP